MGSLKSYNPALAAGHKIRPQDISGMFSLPYVGNVFYVDASGGANTNGGRRQNDAFLNVATALDACTASDHNAIIIAPTGGTGRTAEATAIAWNKRFTHLIGSAAPTVQDARAGLGFSTGGSLVISQNRFQF